MQCLPANLNPRILRIGILALQDKEEVKVDPYKADEFRVEAVVGDKEIDTIFTDGEPMKKDFHTFGVIDTIAATVAMLGE